MKINLPSTTSQRVQVTPVVDRSRRVWTGDTGGGSLELLAPVLNAARTDPDELARISSSMVVHGPRLDEMVKHRLAMSSSRSRDDSRTRKRAALIAEEEAEQRRLRLARLAKVPRLDRMLGGCSAGPGSREEALDLAKRARALPSSFFLERPYNAESLATYIGASNALRELALRGQARWDRGGWQVKQGGIFEDVYTREMEYLKVWIEKEGVVGGPSLKALLQQRRLQASTLRPSGSEDEHTSRLWSAVVAGEGYGDLDFGNPLRSVEPVWSDFQALALPLRILTVEQVGMAFPGLNHRAIEAGVETWRRHGLLKAFGELGGLRIWQVTEKAVQAGIDAGLLSEQEAASRLVVRRTQEAHDLGVGDAMLLLTLHALEAGYQVREVETETGIRMDQSTGMVPDFRLRLDMGPVRVNQVVDVEVVGTGRNYRFAEKLKGVRERGMKLFSVGLDGMGVRHG